MTHKRTKEEERIERNLVNSIASGSAFMSEEDRAAFGRMIPTWGSGMTEGALRKEAKRAENDLKRTR
ncbi:Uncharacterised protein [uncultured archaeon]|nr:Uncharacterised protein [uncultured archaeon]